MKKLMFAVAAVAAGVALADVTSANVVGYNNVNLRDGNTMTGPDFKAISASGKIDLTSISVGGEAYMEGECGGVVYIQVLKYNGSTESTYEWRDITGDFDPGWYNDLDEMIDPETVYFDPAQGLWVQGEDGYDLQFPALILNK